jgi:hypothetical protein
MQIRAVGAGGHTGARRHDCRRVAAQEVTAVSTSQPSGRHEAGTSDPWSTRSYGFDDDRYSPYDSNVRDEPGSPYYRELRDLPDDPEPTYVDDPYDDPDVLYDEPPSGGALRHVMSAILCLALTPIGIASMTYGVDRYANLTLQQVGAERDLRGLVGLGLGAGVLLIVAWLGAVSPIGPVLSGAVWGLLPAVLYLIDPRDTARQVSDLPALPDSALSGAVTWLSYGAFLMVGALLVGAGFASTGRRRAPT